ncbi:MAG: ABC transporter ATP-binding protein [Alphaproteobacteria bacterium]|nr:ABC transporter ATP-binding protein [Alphaproteobacteria bacterium]
MTRAGSGNLPAAVDARGLVKRFPAQQTPALDHLDFCVGSGEMVAIVGPSGSGKSTLLYALSGLIALDAGTVSVNGQTPDRPAAWTLLRRTAIGLVFQEDWLIPTLTAGQNIELPMLGAAIDKSARVRRVRSLLADVNGSELFDRRPASLSGGERQRVAVARGLANMPRILLADEPTGELDTANSRAIIDLLKRLRAKKGLTVIIVTHDLQVAEACDRQFLVVDGRGTDQVIVKEHAG